MGIALTPEPPYWAVIFSSVGSGDEAGYAEMSARMEALAAEQPGYLGLESVGDERLAITISYWRSEADIAAWRKQVDHVGAQKLGRERWYRSYHLRVARVERARRFERGA